MTLPKELGEMLYELFGPNGQDLMISTGTRLRMKAAQELERHGIVKLEHSDKWKGTVQVKRLGRTLCETFSKP